MTLPRLCIAGMVYRLEKYRGSKFRNRSFVRVLDLQLIATEMVGIDQPQSKRWLKFSEAERVDWRLYSTRQTADSGDYWREADNLSSIRERTVALRKE